MKLVKSTPNKQLELIREDDYNTLFTLLVNLREVLQRIRGNTVTGIHDNGFTMSREGRLTTYLIEE